MWGVQDWKKSPKHSRETSPDGQCLLVSYFFKGMLCPVLRDLPKQSPNDSAGCRGVSGEADTGQGPPKGPRACDGSQPKKAEGKRKGQSGHCCFLPQIGTRVFTQV